MRPPVFQLTQPHREGTAFKWFYGETAERDAVQLWKETAAQGSRLHKLDRDTGVWEPVGSK